MGSMGSMGLAKPINFEIRVLKPIHFLGDSLEITHVLTLKPSNFDFQKSLQTNQLKLPTTHLRNIEITLDGLA